MRSSRSEPSARGGGEHQRRVVLRKGAHEPSLASAPRPSAREGHARLRTLHVGLDGTDNEVLEGDHGAFPPGADELVLGHECLAEVIDAPDGSGLAPGERVVPLVRHGCGLCGMCAHGHADMCETSLYKEHGIRGLDGFLQDEWTDEPATLVKVPERIGEIAVLTEPLSIVVKALEAASIMQRRVPGYDGSAGKRVLLAGTGSLGTLAGFALVFEGAKVHALDRSDDSAAAPRLLKRIGVQHANGRETTIAELAREAGGFDLILEATGSARVAFDCALALRENGVLCLLGVPPQKPAIPIEADDVMRQLVLKNGAVFGSVNSNAHHMRLALQCLEKYRERWGGLLDEVVTHRYSPDEAVEAFRADDESLIKKVVDWRE